MSSIRVRSIGAAIAAVTLAACGSDASESEPSAPDEPAAFDVAEVRAELDAVEFESAGVPMGPLLGDTALAEDTESADAADGTAVGGDPPSEDCEELGDCSEGHAVDPDHVSGEALEPIVFTPTPAWAPFCTVLGEIEGRELPVDPIEALRVIDIWFGLLQRHVPAEIAADLALLDTALDRAVETNDATLLEAASPEFDAAGERIGDAVDANCAGR